MVTTTTSGYLKVVHYAEQAHVCSNADTKPDGVQPHTMLWVYDTDTTYWTPDGHIWVKTKGNNSIFSNP